MAEITLAELAGLSLEADGGWVGTRVVRTLPPPCHRTERRAYEDVNLRGMRLSGFEPE